MIQHIALIGPVYPYRGGIAHYNSHLAKHIQSQGLKVSVFSFRRQYPGWLYPGESDRDPSQAPLQVDATYLLDPLYPWTWIECAKAIRNSKPDVVIIPWWVTFWAPAFGMLIRWLRGHFPVIVLIHNVIPHESKPWDVGLTRFALGLADGYIVQTEEQQKRLLSILPGAVDKVALCPHPIYDLISEKQVDQTEARRNLGLPEERQNLLFFGIIRAYKGLRQLLDALAILNRTGSAPSLTIAGEFWEKLEEYQQHIQQNGLQDLVRIFPGYQPDEKLPEYFSAADILVAPYLGGTQSGVVKLALGAGLPVMISPTITDPLLETLKGQGVTYCNPVDPNQFAQQIDQVLKGKANRLDPSEMTRKSWQNLLDAIQKLIVEN